jgi:nitrate/nitrite-specific signal transduction histidine kinase
MATRYRITLMVLGFMILSNAITLIAVRLVGLATVEASLPPDQAQALGNRMLTTGLPIVTVVVLLGAGAFLLLARRFLVPIGHVVQAIEAIEAQTYNPAILEPVTRLDDDLGHLARVLDKMAQTVHAREVRLTQQVQELQIEVNSAKQAQEVEALTETDYFRDLQRRAHERRVKEGRE